MNSTPIGRVLLVCCSIWTWSSRVANCFQEISIDVTLDEEQDNGTLLVDLRQSIPSLANETTGGYKREFLQHCPHFYLNNNEHDRQTFFRVYAQRLDRETICPHESECQLLCKLYLNKDEIKLIAIRVRLRDVNDHRGRFGKRIYSYELDETSPVGYRFQLEQVHDDDFDQKNKFYSLGNIDRQDSFPFALDFDTGHHLLELRLIKSLQSRLDSLLEFDLTAEQDGQVEDRCRIQIRVLAAPENHLIPQFEQAKYRFVVVDLRHRFVGRVRTNNDNRNQIFYRLISTNNSIDSNGMFAINETTGDIFVRQANGDLLANGLYELVVEAFNVNYLSSLTTVEVNLNATADDTFLLTSKSDDDDDHDHDDDGLLEIFIPKLFDRERTRHSTQKIFVDENHLVPLTICQIFVSSSMPSALNMNTSFDSSYFHLKQLDQQSFELLLLKPFDYEAVQQVSLEFTLTGSRPKKKFIDIVVENQNDCPPILDQTMYVLTIEENNPSPVTLHTFHASDPDQLDPLTYELHFFDRLQSYEDLFVINATGGQLYLLHALDREKQSNYSLQVCVFDQVHRTCSPCSLHVLDQNDNQCAFPTASLVLTIGENLAADTLLAQVHASDPDQGHNGTLFYSFQSPNSHLHLDPMSGTLHTTSTSFDYESRQNFSATITACDSIRSGRSLCCSIELLIDILDEDDHAPYLIYPSLSHNQVFIIHYVNQTMMPYLKGFDQDLDSQHRAINFSVIGGSLNSSLAVDASSGQLSLHQPAAVRLPLYGTLLVSLSLQTNFLLTILVHGNQTDPQLFLKSIQQPSLSFSSLLLLFLLLLLLLLLPFLLLIFYFCKKKQLLLQRSHSLINTPSTTTLSSKSVSNNRKIFETYYSFEDTLAPGTTQI
jgi:hypothetical protein